MRRPIPILESLAMAALVLVCAAPAARAMVRPPADSLQVEVRWLDRNDSRWHVRIRLERYFTTGSAPGAPSSAALAVRVPDSLAVTGVDSALIVLRGTQVPMPGFPPLAPSAAAANGLRTQPGAPAGGVWFGALSVTPGAIVLPNVQVDVCWFLDVKPGTSDAALLSAARAMRFGSATANTGGTPTANVAYKGVTQANPLGLGGGGSVRKMGP